MKKRYGFTLAELLIVIMLVAVIATITIPMLMRGVAEAHYKSAYKKAYNAMANVTGKENIAGTLPKRRSVEQTVQLYGTLANSLNIKEFVRSNGIDDGVLLLPSDDGIKRGFQIKSNNTTIQVGLSTENTEGVAPGVDIPSTWMVSDDGIAYSLVLSGDDNEFCPLKAEITSQDTAENAVKAACSIVVVDVNGLFKGPNRLERQTTTSGESSSKVDHIENVNHKMLTLTRDRYYIYIGADGATTGPTSSTVSGRIINDLK